MDSLVAALRTPSCADPASQCHSDPIELSNACRAFYQSRLESARALRERWGPTPSPSPSSSPSSSPPSPSCPDQPGAITCRSQNDKNENCRKKSSIDIAMETLRQEMASLMEQDLSLMKQLLTLNEEIEELKWRRRYCWSRTSSMMTSSGDVDLGSLTSFTSSEASLGWWRGESGDMLTKYPGISSLSLHTEHNRLSVYDEEDPMGTFNRRGTRSKGSLRALTMVGGGAQGHHHLHHLHHHQQQQQQQQLQQKQEQQQYQQQQQQEVHRHSQPQLSDSSNTLGEETVDKNFAERESFDSGIHEGYVEPSTRSNSNTEMTHL